jgi:hypothetical protein
MILVRIALEIKNISICAQTAMMQTTNASYLQVANWMGLSETSSAFQQNYQHLEDSCRSYHDDYDKPLNQSAGCLQEAPNDLYEFVRINIWYIVSKLPYLFYLVWPTETMFPGLDQVPRYVTEVS